MQKVVPASKGEFTFEIDGQTVLVSGNFDSGNCRSADYITGRRPYIQIKTALDSYRVEVTSKACFHFMVQGYPTGRELVMRVVDVKLLGHLQKVTARGIQAGKLGSYRPYVRMGAKGDYTRLPADRVTCLEEEDRIDVEMRVVPTDSVFYVSFALPYTYERYLNFIRDLPKQCSDYYLRKEVLTYSLELRLVHLLTISSFDEMRNSSDVIGGESNSTIFPQRHITQPQKDFPSKPVVIISARVHPGESQSSHCIEGIIKFLMSSDLRAYILRRHFQFLIVPMLNPDGVYYGYYRMDTNAINLNRYYVVCDSRQPTIYSLRHLINYYTRSKRLLFFFDLHGHPRSMGSFLYGNAMDDVVSQTETCLFAKLLSLNSQTFEFNECIFSKMEMKCRDRLDQLTKEGCGRVYTYRYSEIIHSYTFELGFHTATLHRIQPESNEGYIHHTNGGQSHCLSVRQPPIEEQPFQFEQQHYHSEGMAILVSILDCLQLNPYSRIPNTQFKQLAEVRRQVSKEVLTMERFRIMEKNGSQTINTINQLIHELFFKQITERGFFRDFSKKWPTCVNFARYSPPKKLQRTIVKKRSLDITIRMSQEGTVMPLLEDDRLASLTIDHGETELTGDYRATPSQQLPATSRQQKLLAELKAYQQAMEGQRHSESYSPSRHKAKLRLKYNASKQQKKQIGQSAMLDLLNFDDSKLQMHRFTAVALQSSNKLPHPGTSLNLLPVESEELVAHQSQLARVSEYRSVFGLRHQQERSQVKLVHVAAREQQRNEGRAVSRQQTPSDITYYSRRRSSNKRQLTPTELPMLDTSMKRFTMYSSSKRR